MFGVLAALALAGAALAAVAGDPIVVRGNTGVEAIAAAASASPGQR
jgi:hypothetical protein